MGSDIAVGQDEGLEELKQKETIKSLVVEDVRILKRTVVVDVPKYKPVEQIKYETKIEEQVKYNTKEEDTVKFMPKEVPTTKFITKEQDTIKYRMVEKEYEVERPVLKDVRYERPVIVDKEHVIATFKDVDALKELLSLIPTMMLEIEKLKIKLSNLKEYKLVEEIVKAPKIVYVSREEERIVWKDVPRERCKECSKEVL